jgi:hypothetical protein
MFNNILGILKTAVLGLSLLFSPQLFGGTYGPDATWIKTDPSGISGLVAIINGGTGATTAAGARSNLAVPSLTGTGASGSWNITAATATNYGGIVAIANGGTGTTTASSARYALDVPQKNGTGASGTWGIDVTGNAGTVTNGVYTSGSYSNPTWLTALAISKLTGLFDVSHGGTNTTTANGAFNTFAPSQTGNSGKYLTTDGANTSWGSIAAGVAWGAITGTLSDQTDLVSAFIAKQPFIATSTTATYYRGDKTFQTLNKAAVGLSLVENTALSTWVGSAFLSTLGTITSGLWHGTPIGILYGGTGTTTKQAGFDALAPTSVKGDLIVYNGTHNVQVPVGISGYVLTAKSSGTNGMAWESVSSTVREASFGNGSDGVFLSNTGTTTLTKIAYQYTDFTLGGTAAITSQQSLGNKCVYIFVQNDLVVTSTNALAAVNFNGFGGAGGRGGQIDGAAGTVGTSGSVQYTSANNGTGAGTVTANSSGFGGGGGGGLNVVGNSGSVGSGTGSVGTGGVSTFYSASSTISQRFSGFMGGGGGGASAGISGAADGIGGGGGFGGGCVIFYVGGNINLTGTFQAKGNTGSAGQNGSGGYGGGGGGGGGGGFVGIFYAGSITANSSTITVTGGAGGAGGTGVTTGGAGGAGGAGTYSIQQIILNFMRI